jgi:DNA-binding MarR family transcriptional regulator
MTLLTGVPEEILVVLKQIYAKKGRNFTFKCRLLAKILGYPGQRISRNMPKLEKKGMVVKKSKARNAIIYKTCFE